MKGAGAFIDKGILDEYPVSTPTAGRVDGSSWRPHPLERRDITDRIQAVGDAQRALHTSLRHLAAAGYSALTAPLERLLDTLEEETSRLSVVVHGERTALEESREGARVLSAQLDETLGALRAATEAHDGSVSSLQRRVERRECELNDLTKEYRGVLDQLRRDLRRGYLGNRPRDYVSRLVKQASQAVVET